MADVEPSERFGAFVRDYGEVVLRLAHADVRRLQPSPHASIAYGSAGLAYALWHAARGRDPTLLEAADRLIREVARSRAKSAYALQGAVIRPGSIFCGEAGVRFVRILVGRALGVADRRAEQRFLDTCHARGPVELMQGRAGCLAALAFLQADGSRLAASLVRHLIRTKEEPDRWDSLAHGWPGVCLAVLAWLRATGAPPPDGLYSFLADRAQAVPSPRGPPKARSMVLSWCNGAAGHALLWARAYESFATPRFLDLAVAAAERIAAWDGFGPPSLCCGRVGWAYAYAAVDRVAPGGGWRRRALVEADAVLASAPTYSHTNGLFWGYPGLYCLSSDLLADVPLRFPCVEPP